jgi:hypothetical protein
MFHMTPEAERMLRPLRDYQEKTRNNPTPFYCVTLDVPHKPRTTGEKSQNHAINGFCQQIAKAMGWEFEDVKTYAKQRAIKYGYPIQYDEDDKARTDPWGNVYGVSETELSTTEAGYLIDALHEIAAENGIVLREG